MPTGDEAIDAAFATSPIASASSDSSTGDEAIDAAFASEKASSARARPWWQISLPGRPAPVEPAVDPDLFTNAGKAVVGGAAHTAGTLADVATGTAPGEGSHAQRWSAPFAVTDPTEQLDASQIKARQTVSDAYDRVAGTGPAATEIKTRIPQAAEAIGAVTPFVKAVGGAFTPGEAISAQAALDRQAANSPQSMGAAAAAPQISSASAPIQQAITSAVRKGPVNMDAVVNHWEADQHGVQLTEGQATRDPTTFSNEQNSTHSAVVKRINDQNQQLTDAIDNVRREAAPGAVQNDPIENGQIAVDSLKAYDEPVRADIDAKYDAARKASANGDLQMDGSSFVSDANAALKPQSKFRFLPATVKGIVDDVANADGKMNLNDYQAYETQLGNEIAKAKAAGDGNAVAAIAKVKGALENVQPIGEETAQAKALFDTARSAAKARFDELDADPAYRVAVDDVSLNKVKKGEPSALADKFLDKYALQAPKANLDRLMGKLGPDGQQAVTAHTLSTIRKGAVTANGNVSPYGFNSAVAKYGPKLESLVPAETRESLDSLGRVITNVKVPPSGHFVDYSKSGVIANAAQGVARPLGEAALNAKTFGLGVPIVKGIAENNFAKRVLAPGAGISRVPDVSPPP